MSFPGFPDGCPKKRKLRGEIIGLEDSLLCPGEIRVEWQIREVGGKFYRLPPKDDSYRSPAWEPCLPVDVPPFLAALLTRQADSPPPVRRATPRP